MIKGTVLWVLHPTELGDQTMPLKNIHLVWTRDGGIWVAHGRQVTVHLGGRAIL